MQPDRNIDRELKNIAPRLEYPPTPDLAGSVRARLEVENGNATGGAPARTGPRLRWVAAAAIVVLVALPVFGAVLNKTGDSFSGPAGGGGEVVQKGGDPGGTETGDAGGSGSAGASSGGGDDVPTSGGRPEGAASASAAACAYRGPILEARPGRGAPGNEFEVRGRHFVAGFSACDDTPPVTSARSVPASGVEIEFGQDGRTWRLGSVEADGNARISATFRIPSDARVGRATVRGTYEQGPGAPPGEMSASVRFMVLDE